MDETPKEKIKRVSYSLEPEYQELFKRIKAVTRRSLTDELRMMLDARATALGIEPIKEVDPKSFAPTLEIAHRQGSAEKGRVGA